MYLRRLPTTEAVRFSEILLSVLRKIRVQPWLKLEDFGAVLTVPHDCA
jgi:hypothetical protein